MIARLHRIEALPRPGEYAVGLRSADGHELTVVMSAADGAVTAAQATLPDGWGPDSERYQAAVVAVLAVEHARGIGPVGVHAVDVPGGWDVSLGNVVLAADGGLSCVAHEAMTSVGDGLFECPECGARAQLVGQ